MRKLLCYGAFFLLMTHCDTINPEETAPSYVYIPSASLSTNPSQGEATEKITNLWVYSSTDLIGTYPMPAQVTFLETDGDELQFFAGIQQNGISTTVIEYPFYEPIKRSTPFNSLQTDTFSLEFTYKSNALISFLQNFESANDNFIVELDGDTETFLESVDEGVLDGRCGKIVVTEDHPIAVVGSRKLTVRPQDRGAVYVEMDYLNEGPINIGLIGFNDSGNEVYNSTDRGVNPRTSRNKVYFDMSDHFTFMNDAGATSYQIYFGVSLPRDGNGDLLRTEANVYIDNVKLVHF